MGELSSSRTVLADGCRNSGLTPNRETWVGLRSQRSASGMAAKARAFRFHMFGMKQIIGVEELHKIAGCGEHGRISRRTHSGIGLADDPDAIAERSEPSSRVVARAIVNHHDLNVRIALLQAILYRRVRPAILDHGSE